MIPSPAGGDATRRATTIITCAAHYVKGWDMELNNLWQCELTTALPPLLSLGIGGMSSSLGSQRSLAAHGSHKSFSKLPRVNSVRAPSQPALGGTDAATASAAEAADGGGGSLHRKESLAGRRRSSAAGGRKCAPIGAER